MYDVYVAGIPEKTWREKFKEELSDDISVFDPLAQESIRYDMKNAKLIVFYFNHYWNGDGTLLYLGDVIKASKPVIICTDGNIRSSKQMDRYSEQKNVTIVNSIEELVSTAEEYIAQMELCKVDELPKD